MDIHQNVLTNLNQPFIYKDGYTKICDIFITYFPKPNPKIIFTSTLSRCLSNELI